MESTAPNRRQQIAALLKRYWGFDTFRPVQEQVILSVTCSCTGRNVSNPQ